MENAPSEQELLTLLGEKVYRFYSNICANTISLLSPDLEIWDYAGRRGKYWHGYYIRKKSLSIDLYLSSEFEQITCDFHFNKRFFQKILKQRDLLKSAETQKIIDFSIKFNEEYGGGYSVSLIIREEEEFQDVLKIIEIVSSRSKTIRK